MTCELTEVAPDLFSVTADLRLGPGFRLSTNMAIVKSDDALWVHSPLPLATGWADAAERLGEVRVLVAPSAYHHLYVGDAAERFPDAIVLGPAALKQKRDDLDLAATLESLEERAPAAWPAQIRAIGVGGAPKASEFLFYDERTKTLLCTDLLFNNTRPTTVVARLFVRMTSGWKGPARSMLWRFLVKDKAKFSESLEPLDDLDIERVLPAHGRIIDDTDAALSLMRSGRVEH